MKTPKAPGPRASRKRREDDRTPLDCCAWCLKWIGRRADRRVVPLELAEAPAPGEHFAEILIDDHPLFGIVPQPGSPYLEAGAHLVVIVCGVRCAEALEEGLRADAARGRGETPGPHREPTEEERRKAERLVRRVCAWCLKPIPRTAPVVGVHCTLLGDQDRSAGMTAIMIAGRPVPGSLAEPGSAAAMEGSDIGFLLCGEDCADALRAAIALDKSLSVVH